MKWITDRSGRLTQRPHYEPAEIDQECEAFMAAFLQGKYRIVTYPVSTNDLTILLERETDGLDLYADLKLEGEEVEGVTDFSLDRKKPRVSIARELSEQNWRENRLRTTLTHELGHVKFHNFLGSISRSIKMSLYPGDSNTLSPVCKRAGILNSKTVDWIEWQAGYASGAYLMPITRVRQLVAKVFDESGSFGPVHPESSTGKILLQRVQTSFQVSSEAAKVRLLKLGYLSMSPSPLSLFSSN